MKFAIILTWSKILALLTLGCAVFLDVKLGTDGKLFMYALPFITAMIGLKQVLNKDK